MRPIVACSALVLALAAGSFAHAQTPPAPRAPAPRPAPEARPVAAPTPAPDRQRTPTVTFQVVVLMAEAAGNQRPEGLSPRAEKALADVRDFLPYKSYHVLDSAWMHTDFRAETRLSGATGQDLYLQIRLDPTRRPDDPEIHVDSFRLIAFTGPKSTRDLLTSSFGIRPGETIVVGTSKLDGPDKALVVLLSAMP